MWNLHGRQFAAPTEDINFWLHSHLRPTLRPVFAYDELIKVRFVFYSSGCAWAAGKSFVTHVSVNTLELANSSSNCADIHCTAAMNMQQARVMNVSWLLAFLFEALDNKSLFLTEIHYDKNCFPTLIYRQNFVQSQNLSLSTMLNSIKTGKKTNFLRQKSFWSPETL